MLLDCIFCDTRRLLTKTKNWKTKLIGLQERKVYFNYINYITVKKNIIYE